VPLAHSPGVSFFPLRLLAGRLPYPAKIGILPLMSQPKPINFAICNEIFKGWNIVETLTYVAQTGYDALEIAPFTLADSVAAVSAGERIKIRESAARAGIAISGIHWVLVKPEGLYINHTDAAIRERTSKYFCQLVDFCADVGGKFMVVGSPKQRNVMPGVAFEQAWEWATATFRDPVARAAERGITICFEPLAPAETNFINTAAEAVRFVRQLDNPHFKIILDAKAMCSEAKPIPQLIRESWPHFAYFHANDRNLKGPGFGDVDFQPIAAALKDTGYQGYVSVEVFNFDEGPKVIAEQSLRYLKQTFGA
jgi:sugar phosphate isomerase/epimerase